MPNIVNSPKGKIYTNNFFLAFFGFSLGKKGVGVMRGFYDGKKRREIMRDWEFSEGTNSKSFHLSEPQLLVLDFGKARKKMIYIVTGLFYYLLV